MRTKNALPIRLLGLMVVLGVLATILAACGNSAAPATSVPQPPAAAGGAALLEERCSACHGTGTVTSQKMSADQWERTVTSMIKRGAKLTDAEKAVLVEYLAATYGN